MKSCSTCKGRKPIKSFQKYKRATDGLYYQCKKCQSVSRRRHYWENRDKEIERAKKWTNDNRESVLAKDKRWREKNAERRRRHQEEYYEENRERLKKRQREYSKTPRGRFVSRLGRYSRKVRKGIAVESPHYTASEWEEMLNRLNHKCQICGKADDKLTLDHIIPISKGGGNSIWNIQPLCASCNGKKYNKILTLF